jgi:CubicO group peptidase (beta-lactamase class C family)
MPLRKIRLQTWLLLLVLGVGGVITAILGLFAFVMITAETWHPDPQKVPSDTQAAPPAKWADAVDQARQTVRANVAEQNLPGLSVAVGIGGDIVWAEGFGWADLDARLPPTPRMKFRIGTASKVLTSAAVGLLLEDRRLKLDDEIQTYVPTYPRKQWPVTLRQLMGHLAGVTTDGGDEGPYDQHCKRPVEALRIFADDSLRFEPGTRYRYSNYGWMLVSAAVEAAAQEPFLTFMRKRIFEPLGMDDTLADSATDPIPNRVTPYFPRFGADPRYGLHRTRRLDFSCYAGASAFLSTPSDLVRFAMAVNGGKLLQPATVQLLQTSQRLPSGEETGYGLGWDVETVQLAGAQTRAVGYDGEVLGGPLATLMTFPEQGIVVAVTSNISYADTSAIAVGIARAFARPLRASARLQ